jgi:zinc protease
MLALLLSCVHPTPAGPAPIDALQSLKGEVVTPVEGGKVVYAQATIRAGSAYDPTGQEGVASLTANLLRQGGTTTLGPEQVDAALYALAADIDVVIDKETVTFRGKALAEDAETFLPLFTSLVTQPAFDDAAFNRLRADSIEHLTNGVMSSDELLGDMLLDIWLHEGHPYGHPIQGRIGALDALDLQDVKDFYNDAYVKSAVTIGLAAPGADTLATSFIAAFDGLGTTRPLEATPKPRPIVDDRRLLVVEKQTDSTGIHFGHPLEVDRNHQDYAALTLAMTAFGEHRQGHGRLFSIMRTARGLNYGDYAYIEHYVQTGWSATRELSTSRVQNQFYVWIRPTSLENGPFATKLALQLVEELVADGLREDEFNDIKAYMLRRMGLWAQEPGRRLGFQVDAVSMDHPNLLETLPAQIEALTLEQVNAAITAHISTDAMRFVVVTNDGAAFGQSLLEDSETPIVYNGVQPDEEQAAVDTEVASKKVEVDSWSVVAAEGIFR